MEFGSFALAGSLKESSLPKHCVYMVTPHVIDRKEDFLQFCKAE